MRWSAVAAGIGIGCLVGALAAGSAGADQDLDRKLAPSLRAGLAAGDDSFPVIVTLHGTGDTRRPLARTASGADDRRRLAVANLIDTEQAALRAYLDEAELASVRPFQLQPAYAATLTRRGLLAAARRSGVASVEPDLRLQAHTAEGLAMIGVPPLRELGLTGEGTAVAIVDTGIDAHHPTLGGGAIPNAKVVRGLDTADMDDDPADCGGHGTAVASIAAGTSYHWSPQSRFAGGVAPQAKILAYKASPDADCGSFTLSAVIAAMEDAVIHRSGDGYRLVAINLSLGGGAFEGPCDDFSPSYASAVETASEAGIAVVASTGNEGSIGSISAPACASEVLAVGSVWDSDSGWIGYSFCLDPECRSRCDDSFQPAGRVTCYTNSGPMLDVFAPSEYLEAAAAGGQTLGFGGTSGAAAYVTGALALLAQAAPDLEAGGLRRAVQLSGEPTLDTRSGLVRRRVDLVDAHGRMDRFHPGPGVPLISGGGSPTTSTTTVDQDGTIGSVRVLLHLLHPDPRFLEISLLSPAGTRVRLHERGPGTIPASGSLPHQDAIWGVYPDEIEPVESLGVFAGEAAAGAWVLEILDASGPDGTGGSARLSGWALSIEPAEPPAAGGAAMEVLPVVAHAAGAMGTAWRSDVRIFNPSPERSVAARLYFVPSAEDGSQVYRQTELVLPQASVVDLPDVVGRRFAGAGPRGALFLRSELAGAVLTSRTYTGDTDVGTFGQYVAPVDPGETTVAGGPELVIGELGDGNRRRTNVGVTEVSGEEATVRIRRIDGGSGLAVGMPTEHRIAPWSHLQLALPAGAGLGDYALVEVSTGSGRVAAYASLVDNGSGDAVFVPARRAVTAGQWVVPVVASQPGVAGTLWRSSLRVVNLGSVDASLDLELTPRRGSGGAPATAAVTVAPGRQLAVDDVVSEIFGRNRGVGLLRVAGAGGPVELVVTSRTYNDSPEGTFGQLVPSVRTGVGPHAVLSHVDATPSLRTNLGLAEVAGAAVQVRCTIRDAIGRRLGNPVTVALEPYQLDQIDDVFAASGAERVPNARIDLDVTAGDGQLFGYASVVDRTTGDAIFVPAVTVVER